MGRFDGGEVGEVGVGGCEGLDSVKVRELLGNALFFQVCDFLGLDLEGFLRVLEVFCRFLSVLG